VESITDSGQSVVEYYERLRLEAVRGNLRSGPGLGVLMSRGMVALMRLVDQTPQPKKLEEPQLTERVQPLLVPETELQIVQLLAAMVLSRHQEVMHVY
jgi:hypothetical protein